MSGKLCAGLEWRVAFSQVMTKNQQVDQTGKVCPQEDRRNLLLGLLAVLPRRVQGRAGSLYAKIESLRERIRDDELPLLFGKLLLVYQMPKTGSQTVEATLARSSLPHRILRFHYLSRTMAAEIRRGPASNSAPELWAEAVRPQLAFMGRMGRILFWRRILRWFGFRIPKIEIIAAVRDPIGLALSSVFENHACFFSNVETATLEDFSSVLSRPRVYAFQRWFDMELKAFTGLRIYKTPFPREKGYAIYENRFARILVYRFDALPRLPLMLREFLNLEVACVTDRNVGSSKQYADRYAWVKKNLRLPADLVAAQLNTKMIRHFYSPEERKILQRQWSEPALDEARPESVQGAIART